MKKFEKTEKNKVEVDKNQNAKPSLFRKMAPIVAALMVSAAVATNCATHKDRIMQIENNVKELNQQIQKSKSNILGIINGIYSYCEENDKRLQTEENSVRIKQLQVTQGGCMSFYRTMAAQSFGAPPLGYKSPKPEPDIKKPAATENALSDAERLAFYQVSDAINSIKLVSCSSEKCVQHGDEPNVLYFSFGDTYAIMIVADLRKLTIDMLNFDIKTENYILQSFTPIIKQMAKKLKSHFPSLSDEKYESIIQKEVQSRMSEIVNAIALSLRLKPKQNF